MANQTAGNMYKQSTRKDYIFRSADLVKLVKSVQVINGVFTGHSVLSVVELWVPTPPRDRYHWPSPEPIDPQQIVADKYHAQLMRQRLAHQYQAICKQSEQWVHEHFCAQGQPGLLPGLTRLSESNCGGNVTSQTPKSMQHTR